VASFILSGVEFVFCFSALSISRSQTIMDDRPNGE